MLNHCSARDLHASSVHAPKKKRKEKKREGARDCFDKKSSPLVSVCPPLPPSHPL